MDQTQNALSVADIMQVAGGPGLVMCLMMPVLALVGLFSIFMAKRRGVILAFLATSLLPLVVGIVQSTRCEANVEEVVERFAADPEYQEEMREKLSSIPSTMGFVASVPPFSLGLVALLVHARRRKTDV